MSLDSNIEKGTIIVNQDRSSKFYGRAWIPTSKPVAGLLFLHGMGEHIGRYEAVFNQFKAKGILVLGFDFKGFGRTLVEDANLNPGHLFYGNVSNNISILNDISFFWSYLRGLLKVLVGDEEGSKIPLFLMGHSMGGLLALFFAFEGGETDLRGLILSAPLLDLAFPMSSIKIFGAKLLGPIFGTLAVQNDVDPRNLSRIKEQVEKYQKDPLIHSLGTLGTGNFILCTSESLRKRAISLNVPALLIAHGTQDHVTSYPASKVFFESCPVKNKTFKSMEGYFHEMHFDLDSDVVVNNYIEWILEQAASLKK